MTVNASKRELKQKKRRARLSLCRRTKIGNDVRPLDRSPKPDIGWVSRKEVNAGERKGEKK